MGIAGLALLLLLPVFLIVAVAIVLESPGPVFYRAERVGRGGRTLRMVKFRKMRIDAHARKLTLSADERFTRVGRLLTRTRLDELPQLWHVFRGDMSLIGPRPEDPTFVAARHEDFAEILRIRPGIAGYSQVAFADEVKILSTADPVGHYIDGLLPQKCTLDRLYLRQQSLATDARILAWTLIAVLLRTPVAVHRQSGALTIRRRRDGS